MSDATRYTPDVRIMGQGDQNEPEAIMVPDDTGDFVTYAEYEALRADLARVTEERDGLLAFKRSVDEALNSGDGSYTP